MAAADVLAYNQQPWRRCAESKAITKQSDIAWDERNLQARLRLISLAWIKCGEVRIDTRREEAHALYIGTLFLVYGIDLGLIASIVLKRHITARQTTNSS